MAFGLTADGFLLMRLEDVRADLEDALRTELGQNIQLDATSVLGQIVGVMCERFADLWELQEQVYASAYLNGASGAALDDLLALAAIARLAATFSVVTLTLGGTNGTPIPAGSVVADPELNVQWTTLTDATISGGTATTTAQASTTGAIQGLAGTITEIRSPITGWTSVANAADAVLGRDVQSDASARTTFKTMMRAAGGNSPDGLAALLLRLDGVTEAVIIENEHIYEDSDGRPPKSFESVVRGGDDQEIADTIWSGKPAGIETTGSETTAVLDTAGASHDVQWSRPSDTEIYMVVNYATETGFDEDGEAQILAAILDLASSFVVGQDVVPFKFIQHIEVENIAELSIFVGTSPGPVSDDPVVIAKNALAQFDSSRITFNRTT